jgi:CRP/FNR family transcriptional regulator, cyclic AMP receptor protein
MSIDGICLAVVRGDMAGHNDSVRYSAGATIFEEGEPGDCMYVVRSGRVELSCNSLELETVSEGGIFGELALVDQEPRSACAIAATDCELSKIDAKRFEFMVQQTPFFAVEVMRTMARRLRETTKAASASS